MCSGKGMQWPLSWDQRSLTHDRSRKIYEHKSNFPSLPVVLHIAQDIGPTGKPKIIGKEEKRYML